MRLDRIVILIILSIFIYNIGNSQIINIRIDEFQIHDGSIPELSDYVTYRIYAETQNSSDELLMIFGDVLDPLELTVNGNIFNDTNFGGDFADQIIPVFFPIFPALEYDSYWAAGEEPSITSPIQHITGGNFNFGLTSSSIEDSFVGSSWLPEQQVLPDSNGDFLLAQITTDGEITGKFNIAIAPLGVRSNLHIARSLSFANNPIEGCTDGLALNYDPQANIDDGSCYYNSPAIVINEIHYNPCSAQGNDADYEFIELYNADIYDIDISGFVLSQAFEFSFPAGTTIASGEYIVIATNASSYNEQGYQTFQIDIGGMNNSGETILLQDGFGNQIDSVSYDDGGAWPNSPDGTCPSLELIDPYSDNSSSVNWQGSLDDFGTPGFINSTAIISGCTDPQACNFDPAAQSDNGSCILITMPQISTSSPTLLCSGDGLEDLVVISIDEVGQAPNSVFILSDENNDILAVFEGDGPFDLEGTGAGPCVFWLLNYDENNISGIEVNQSLNNLSGCYELSNGIIVDRAEVGCTDPSAINYNPDSCSDDGTCVFGNSGCTDPTSCNYDPTATIDDGSCEPDIEPPYLISDYPSPEVIECDNSLPAIPFVDFEDDCGEVTVDFTETYTPGSCEGEGTFVRTWIATDQNGNESEEVTQIILIFDTTAPVLVDFSDGFPSFSDNCGFVTVFFDGNDTYTGCDQCGNCTEYEAPPNIDFSLTDFEVDGNSENIIVIDDTPEASNLEFSIQNTGLESIIILEVEIFINGQIEFSENITIPALSSNQSDQVLIEDFFSFQSEEYYTIQVELVSVNGQQDNNLTDNGLEKILAVNPEEPHFGVALDGSDSHINLPDNEIAGVMANDQSYTLECWFENNNNNRQEFLLGVNDSSGSDVLLLGYDNNPNAFIVYDGQNHVISSRTLSNGIHHVAYVRDENIANVYIDGQLLESHVPQTTFSATDRWSLGMEFDNLNPSDFFLGLIDEFRIWNVARSESQIQNWMNKTSDISNELGLLGLWRFNEGGGNLAFDNVNNWQATLTEDAEFVLSPAPISDIFPISDIGIEEILNPSTGCENTNEEFVQVRVRNFGQEEINGFDIGLIHDNEVQFSETFSNSINPFSSTDVFLSMPLDFISNPINELLIFTEFGDDENHLNDTLSITINSFPPVISQITEDLTVCAGEIFELESSGGVQYRYFNENDVTLGYSSSISLVSQSSEKIFVEITNEFGCGAIDSVNIQVLELPPPPILNLNDTTLCPYDNILIEAFNYSSHLSWNGILQENYLAFPGETVTAIYEDSLTGCHSEESSINISSYEEIEIITSANFDAICIGDQINLSTNGGISWIWNPTGEASNEINVSPTTTSTYYLNVNDQFCFYEDSLTITVLPSDQPPAAVTNMIPSNGDSDLNLPLNFSWAPSELATSYTLKIWEQEESEDQALEITNLSGINYTLSDITLNYETAYVWKVVSENPCFSTEGPQQVFTTRVLPNLVVENISTPEIAFSGDIIEIAWQVKNIGNGGTIGSGWNDYIYLSQDQVLDLPETTGFGIDEYLGQASNFSALSAGESYEIIDFEIQIPDGTVGTYYIIVYSDRPNQLLETSDLDNYSEYSSIPIELSNYPNIEILSVAPPMASFSGQEISVTYQIANLNPVAAAETPSGFWQDHIYLRTDSMSSTNDAVFLESVNSASLAPDEVRTSTLNIQLPPELFGQYWMVIEGDATDEVYEFAFVDNTLVSQFPINISLTPPPDLEVTDFGIEKDSISNNEEVVVSFQITNSGSTSTVNGFWTDRIYISSDSIFSPNTSLQLHSQTHYGNLNNGEFYNVNSLVTIPDDITGLQYIHILSDYAQQEFEYLFEDNNRVFFPVQVNTPDINFSFEILNSEDLSSGEDALILYSITNIGEGALFNQDVNQLFEYYSTDADESPIELGDESRPIEALFPDSTISFLTTFTLEDGLFGEFIFKGKSDYQNLILEELDEINEAIEGPFDIQLSLSPDLLAQSIIDAPDTLIAGSDFQFEFIILNQGDKTALPNWQNKLSGWQNYILDFGDSIPSGETYPLIFSGTVEQNVSEGEYTINLTLDHEDQVFEYNGESNNEFEFTVYIKGFSTTYPAVDLSTTQVTSNSELFSGETYQITYDVLNDSENNLPSFLWKDQIVLSEDEFWSESDLELSELIQIRSLAPNENYSGNFEITLPEGISGEYYLIVICDVEEFINDSNRLNNQKFLNSSSTLITLTDPNDLIIDDVQMNFNILTGQPQELIYTVKNIGVGQVSGNMTNNFFLSTDQALSNSDYQIANSNQNNVILASGESYQDTLEFILPFEYSGNYFFGISVDTGDDIYEHNAETNNIIFLPVNVSSPPLSDLIISSITAPLTVSSDEEIYLSWQTLNNGDNQISGQLTESVFLSLDDTWDVEDVLLGTSTQTFELQPGDLNLTEYSAILSGLTLSEYYIIVRTDILNNIPETNEDNNDTTSDFPISININTLAVNSTENDILVDYQDLNYRIPVTTDVVGESILVTLDSEDQNSSNEIYISLNDAPTRYEHDFAYQNATSPSQQIVIPELLPENAYLLNYGVGADTNFQAITLEARVIDFEILDVNSEIIGNHGSVTLELSGAKFSDDMSVSLFSPVDTIYASSVYLINSTTAYANFDMEHEILGIYGVQCQKQIFNGLLACDSDDEYESIEIETAVKPDAVEVVINGESEVSINLSDYPSVIGFGNTGTQSFRVEFANTGEIDADNPRIRIESSGNILGLDAEQLSEGLTEIEIPLREDAGPEGILRVGAVGSVQVSFFGGAGNFVIELKTDN